MKRKIKPALLNYLDLKLSNHGAAKLAIEEKDARSLLMYVAEICIGEKEENGDNHGTFVELCQRTVDNNANGESWCMCFIQSVIAYVEEKTGEVSLIAASENCLEVWEQT
ncbi:MAG: hypothetical protein JST62_03020, partial [Bacteroidetes bacterium]|nr:hypothetical protein [Bacteroidota bacterium]